MTCDSYEPLIALHLEGDLPAEQLPVLEAHLAACGRCRDFTGRLRESQRDLKDLADVEIDAAALASVRQRVGASLDRRERRFAWAWNALAAAAVVGIVVALLSPGPRRGAPEPERVTAAPTRAPMPPPESVATMEAPPAPGARAASAPRETTRGHRVAAGPPAGMTLEPPLPHAPDGVLEPSQPVVKLVTSDPDVVIYWVTEPDGGQS